MTVPIFDINHNFTLAHKNGKTKRLFDNNATKSCHKNKPYKLKTPVIVSKHQNLNDLMVKRPGIVPDFLQNIEKKTD